MNEEGKAALAAVYNYPEFGTRITKNTLGAKPASKSTETRLLKRPLSI